MTPRRKARLIVGVVALIPLSGAAVVMIILLSATFHLRRELARVHAALATLMVPEEELTPVESEDTEPWVLARRLPGEGDTERGLELLEKCLDLRKRVVGPRDLDHLKVDFWIRRHGLEVLEEYLRSVALNRDQLRRLAELLDLAGHEDLAAGFRTSDLRIRHHLLEAWERPGVDRIEGIIEPELRDFYSKGLSVSRFIHRMDLYLAGVDERLKLVGPARGKSFDEWAALCFMNKGPVLQWDSYFRTESLFRAEAAASIHLGLGRAAVAISRYHKDHGKAPPSLQALVPAYLKGVPADPYLGVPFKYAFDSVHAKVYSLGWDGDDDGGRDIDDCYEDGDFVWVVRVHATE